MSSLPSGVRLVRLLNEHLNDIMNRERANQNSIHLYCTGPYWVAFERSAYQLRHVFPDSEITPMRLLGYPFPVVMVSVAKDWRCALDKALASAARHLLRAWRRNNTPRRQQRRDSVAQTASQNETPLAKTA